MQPEVPVIYSFAHAPAHILFHLGVALSSLVLGALIFSRRKGTAWHVFFGRLWVLLMLATAISSFFIQARGRFSAIHALSVGVVLCVTYAVFAIRTKRVRQHRISMIGAFAGLCVAGVFTLLPYRMLGQLVVS